MFAARLKADAARVETRLRAEIARYGDLPVVAAMDHACQGGKGLRPVKPPELPTPTANPLTTRSVSREPQQGHAIGVSISARRRSSVNSPLQSSQW